MSSLWRFRMAIPGAVVALDDGDASANPQDPAQTFESLARFRQVLQNETHEDMVEAGVIEGQMEEIPHDDLRL